MIQTKKWSDILIVIGLLIVLISCSGEYDGTDVPLETPGAIDKLTPGIAFKGMTVIDWRFDPDRILIIKGVHGPPYATPFDLVWLDIKNGQLIPLQVPEDGALISCPAQGRNGQVVYSRLVLYLYDSQNRVKTPIEEGCYTIFSPSGAKLAFISDKKIKIYNIEDDTIEQSISLLPLKGENGDIDTGKIGWRIDEQAVYVEYSWFGENHSTFRSEIREIDLETQNQEVMYEGVNIADFSMSPDGRLIVLLETDQTNHQSILKIVLVENRCEISRLIFPPFIDLVRWSPTGESILIDYYYQNPYLLNIKEVFGRTYDQLNCE